jgi:sugar phosphate isomerase/epimerase
MKFAICNETFVDWPIDRAFDFARQCGYTGIEIAPFTLADGGDVFDIRDVPPARRTQMRDQAEKAGLDVVGLHWLLAKTRGCHLTSPDPQERQATVAYLTALVELCHELGGSVLVFGSPQQRNLRPGVSNDEGMKYAAEILQTLMPTCAARGVTIAVEPLGPAEGDFLLTAASAVELIRMVGSPQCQLHLDCKAMASEAQPVADVIRANSQHLVHFHANDPNKLGPGMGDLDFVPILAALREIDYKGWVSVEVFDYSPGVERLVRESIDHLKSLLATS